MNARTLALVCLSVFFLAGSAYAGNITGDSCSIFDAIVAANTDAPAGGCPAGSGADTLTFDGPLYLIPNTDIWMLALNLHQPLPTITSTMTFRTGARPASKGIRPTARYTLGFVATVNPALMWPAAVI